MPRPPMSHALTLSLAALSTAVPCWGQSAPAAPHADAPEPPVHAAPPVVAGPVPPPVPDQAQENIATGQPECCPDAAASPTHRRWRPTSTGPAARTRPFGAATRALFGAQVAAGQAATLVLYRYDFVPGKAALRPAGHRKLARLALRLAQTPFPLIIQPSDTDAGLDRARRRAVTQALAETSPPIAAERVLVARPPARGLRAEEAEMRYDRWRTLGRGDVISDVAPPTTAPTIAP